MNIQFLSLALLLLLLSACAHKTSLTSAEFNAHQTALTPLNYWTFSGKLGIKSPAESGSASIRWQQAQAAYEIHLHGPLGQKSLSISGDAQQVSLKEKGKPTVHSHSAEALIQKTTGWNLPVTQLTYWIRGLPAPKAKIKQITPNPTGLMAQLKQSGWVIDYQSYHQIQHHNQEIYLPKKIVASRQDIRLTLVIREWKL